MYKHFTIYERECLQLFIDRGYTIAAIAKKLDRNKSSISREINRNREKGVYIPIIAENKYKDRRKRCKPKYKLDNKEIYDYVKEKFINHNWSPEQISGRLKKENSKMQISYQTIYRGIYLGLFDEKNKSHGNRGAIRKLRHKGKSRHTARYEEKRGKIQISNEIDKRPQIANIRGRIGDYESDTVIGKKGAACLVTNVDRKSKYLICGRAEKKTAECVTRVMIEKLSKVICHTITPDRGKEFANHKEITKALNGVKFYFPSPHHPWERGTNENTNGLLREYFPKGQDIGKYSEEYINDKVLELNSRPRKCLGYKTPYEVFNKKVLHLA